MNQEKITRVIELQNRALDEIEMYGESFYSTTDELLEMFNSLTPQEQDVVLIEYWDYKR